MQSERIGDRAGETEVYCRKDQGKLRSRILRTRDNGDRVG